MNFNQKPGMYNAKNNKLIMDFKELIERSIAKLDEDGSCLYNFDLVNSKNQFYLILPDDIESIFEYCFMDCNDLIGISGKNVNEIFYAAFGHCKNLTEINFPNLISIDNKCFYDCKKLEEKCTNSDGLFIANNCLISASLYKNEELIMPNNIKAIVFNAFENNEYLEKLVLPINLTVCELQFDFLPNEIVLPINFERLRIGTGYYCSLSNSNIYYKGTEEKLRNIINSMDEVDEELINSIIIEPYTINELKELNFSTEQIEQIFDRQLTLDELLDSGKSLKEINNYMKNVER